MKNKNIINFLSAVKYNDDRRSWRNSLYYLHRKAEYLPKVYEIKRIFLLFLQDKTKTHTQKTTEIIKI